MFLIPGSRSASRRNTPGAPASHSGRLLSPGDRSRSRLATASAGIPARSRPAGREPRFSPIAVAACFAPVNDHRAAGVQDSTTHPKSSPATYPATARYSRLPHRTQDGGSGPPRLTSRDGDTAHSSMPAYANACGRLPRSCRWCTSYSSVYKAAGPARPRRTVRRYPGGLKPRARRVPSPAVADAVAGQLGAAMGTAADLLHVGCAYPGRYLTLSWRGVSLRVPGRGWPYGNATAHA
jgi:hypothetical protein